MMWDPVRYLESCPSSDGACAVVFTDEAGGRDAAKAGRTPAWVLGERGALRAVSIPGPRPGSDRRAPPDCATDVYAQAGITNPREQIDCAELYVPFSWYEPMWLEAHHIAGPARRLEDGRVRPDRARRIVPGQHVRRRPVVEPDRRLGVAALRRGRACRSGARPASTRSTGASVAVAQAYGASAQYFTMWVVAEPPRSLWRIGSLPCLWIRHSEATCTADEPRRTRRAADARPGHPLAAAALGHPQARPPGPGLGSSRRRAAGSGPTPNSSTPRMAWPRGCATAA